MPSVRKARSTRGQARILEKRLRRQGLIPITIWVSDVCSPEFRAEARRQSLAVAMSAGADEDQAFADALGDGSD